MPTEKYNIEIGATDTTQQALTKAARNVDTLRKAMAKISSAPVIRRKQLESLNKLQRTMKDLGKQMGQTFKMMTKRSTAGGGTSAAGGGGGAATAMGAAGAELAQGSDIFRKNLEASRGVMDEILRKAKDVGKAVSGAPRAGGAAGAAAAAGGAAVGGAAGAARGAGGAGGGGGGGVVGRVAGGGFEGLINELGEQIGQLSIHGYSVGPVLGAAFQVFNALAVGAQKHMTQQIQSSRITGMSAIAGFGEFGGSEIHQGFATYMREAGSRGGSTIGEDPVGEGGFGQFLSKRATAMGMSPNQLASSLGRARRLMLPGEVGEMERSVKGLVPEGAGFKVEAGFTRTIQQQAARAGMGGARQAEFMRMSEQTMARAVATGSEEALTDTTGLLSDLIVVNKDQLGGRAEILIPKVMQTLAGIQSQTATSLGGTPVTNFTMRAMMSYLKDVKGVEGPISLKMLYSGLTGGKITTAGGKVLDPMSEGERTIAQLRQWGTESKRRGRELWTAGPGLLKMGIPPETVERIVQWSMGSKEDRARAVSELSIAQDKAGVSGKKTDTLGGAGDLGGVSENMKKYMSILREFEGLYTDPASITAMELRLELEHTLVKSAQGSIQFVRDVIDTFKEGATTGETKGLMGGMESLFQTAYDAVAPAISKGWDTTMEVVSEWLGGLQEGIEKWADGLGDRIVEKIKPW